MKYNLALRFLALTLIGILSACVPPPKTTPNNASVTVDENKIPGCQYVSPTQRVENYDTQFYHSQGLAFFPELTNPMPFCRDFKADKDTVSNIVAVIVPQLGNPIAVFDKDNGIFTTNIIERGHLGGRWQDSYSITVTEEQDATLVRILRTLQIRRGGEFRQHPSDGHNEAWILTQISDRLKTTKENL